MSNCRFMVRRGVTIFELLVAMSIFSVLVALVVPSVSGGRADMEKVSCLNTLREIIRLTTYYSIDDPKTIIGPVHPRAANFVFEGYAEYGGGPGTMSFVGWGDEFDPRTRPLNRYIYTTYRGFPPELNNRFAPGLAANTKPGDFGRFREFLCAGNDLGWQDWPGFSGDIRETQRPYFEANGSSYRLNNLTFEGGPQETIVGVYGKSITRIPDPARTIAYHEARVFQTLFTNDVFGIIEQGVLDGYHKRKGYFNVAYCDGSAGNKDFGLGSYYLQNPIYGGFDARGTWGRLDTLPFRIPDPTPSAIPAGGFGTLGLSARSMQPQ